MPCDPYEQCREYRSAEDDPEGGLRQIAARWLVRKLAGKKFEIALDQGEVGSRLIGLAQCRGYSSGICTVCQKTVTQSLDRAPDVPLLGVPP
jgi:hypothetical protein